MQKTIVTMIAVAVMATLAPAAGAFTINYGDVALATPSGGTWQWATTGGSFTEVWDLTKCDMLIEFTVDLTGINGTLNANHAYAQLGVRDTSSSAYFNPSNKGVWYTTDHLWGDNSFAPSPNTQSMHDKMHLQRAGGQGEGAYDLPGAAPVPGNNHRFWFDRDGVDQWQAQSPLAVDGGTYNTNGVYDIAIRLSATSATTGTAYMTVNGLDQGFETDGNWSTMELTPAGMTFTADLTQLQVFYGLGGWTGPHSVDFSDIQVTGCPVPVPEPASMTLLGLGVVGMAVRRLRKRA